ncbi:MAG: glucose 1-dehydrogenase [Dehalococcoidia bacterium]|nr:glucose 1-dehydrogenase [Dehalococcoidia bacterium]
MRLTDKVAIVTGSGMGLGRAYAIGLARAGAKVVSADIKFPEAQEVATEIEAAGGQSMAVDVDVSDQARVREMVRCAVDRLGRVDILINNAGVCADVVRRPFAEISVEEWDKVMAVNVRGMFLCCQAVFPHMKAQGWGKIINVSSSTFFMPPSLVLHYVTSKAAVVGLTRALAMEVGRFGIRVNALAPDLVPTEGGRRIATPEAHQASIKARAIKKELLPEDLVGTVVFLASHDSDFTTGQTFLVDGGKCMH